MWMLLDGKPFQPQVHYFVGGATKVFGVGLYRLRKEDFGELKHYDGVSPAWPLGYDEFEPYYTEAEHLYQVYGEHGSDPTEPPASKPFSCGAANSAALLLRSASDKHLAGLANGSGARTLARGADPRRTRRSGEVSREVLDSGAKRQVL
jgi:hypothetical protein